MSLARNTAVIGGLTLVSRLFGFARDLVLAAALGAGPVADAFLAALRFPNLFRRLFAEGAFSQAFVPVYSKTLAEHGEKVADTLAAEALAVLVLLTSVISAVAIVAMPWINLVLFGGYADNPEIFRLATLLTQITMPYLVSISAATLFAGALNARGRFFAAAAAPSLLNICLLIGVWFFREDQIQAAFAAAIAVTVSGVLQAVWVALGARRSGVRTRPLWPKLSPNVRRLLALAAPAAIAGGALQINVIVSQAIASFEEGAISLLNYADRLYQLPLGLIGVAVGVAMLPRLSRLVQADDQAGARGALDEAVNLSMVFTLPSAAAMLTMPAFLLDGLFARGEFTTQNARDGAMALFHYGWGVPAFVLAKIYAPAFFAREDTSAPMRFAVISMVINVALGAALFFALRAQGHLGFPGLAIATSVAAWVNVLMMIASLSRRGAYAPSAKATWRLGRIILVSAALGAALWFAMANRPAVEAYFGSKELAVLALILGAGVSYFALLFLSGSVSLREVRGAFRREPGPAGGGGALPPGLDG
ncbi:MAG: murein biosynthesis integral membrane protein MurJ [Phycisphaerales bacterium]|nr:murein biosynthesis integral membrane protein MurJ [Hyphomonadaceae bacterium]